ncbi:MAG: putative 2-aminoethylphosphonate ABC transporter ATP-binding protein [Dongiaceae bacterium]
MTPAEPYLVIDRVNKSFGRFQALKDISLAIDKGEFVCFLGPSGCGKTTLLRAIAGLDIQSSGRILQGGRDISALPPSERDFGIVFQSYALFPNLTVERNVGYGLGNLGLAKAEVTKRVAGLLQLVGLAEHGRKYPAQLSGGQQQRVALARALAMSPGLLLLDEPLSALDARVRLRLRQEIKALHRRLGITTVMVTHDQEEALTMADKIVVMNVGAVEQIGTPLDIYRRPASRFVADFIGTMNFLHAQAIDAARVRVGSIELSFADGLPGLRPGAPVTLCVRPEDVVVRSVDSATANAFAARIADLEFLGSFYRARLSPPSNGVEFAADFSINAVRDLDLSPDKLVTIALPADRLRVFPQ